MSNPNLRWTHSDVSLPDSEAPSASSVRSLRSEELDVVFQPVVDLRSGKAMGEEALVRCRRPAWQDPLRLFEEAKAEGFCGRLGRMIREVAFARRAQSALFVNLHPDELCSRWLVRPDDPIHLHPHPTYLEVTESAAMMHFELCKHVLHELRARSGCRIVVDDLGSGYSNWIRLLELEPELVKIDRSLVHELDRVPRKRILCRNVIRLCHELGAKVVAEGIEREEELAAIVDIGADYGQGYLLARPSFPPSAVHWPLKVLT